MKRIGTHFIVIIALALLGAAAAFPGCFHESTEPTNEPVISNVNITPNPVAYPNDVTVAFTYVSPDGTTAARAYVTNAGISVPLTVNRPCNNCTLYFTIDTGLTGRGTFVSQLYVVDNDGRESNRLTFTLNVN